MMQKGEQIFNSKAKHTRKSQLVILLLILHINKMDMNTKKEDNMMSTFTYLEPDGERNQMMMESRIHRGNGREDA